MDQEDRDARVEQSADACILLYASSYGKQGVVKRETVVGMVIIWEERWISVNSRDIADSQMVSRKAQEHLWIDTMGGNIVDKSQEI